MKKIKSVLITVLVAFSLTACSAGGTGSNNSSNTPSNSQSTTSSGHSSDTSKTESTTSSVNSSDISKTESTTSSANSTLESKTESDVSSTASQPEEVSSTPDNSDGTKILVAYFSATNTTEGVANTIAECIGADIYEITPEQPYTSADLNYNDDGSRSTKEMNDPNSRPAISGSVADFEKYDIVFVGYPIWWGEAPRILSTFVESYDFSGKTVVPFCTSGGSGVGSSAKNLEKLTSGANWLDGKRLNGGASERDISDWINGLGLNIGV